jgi:hypothetical protein
MSDHSVRLFYKCHIIKYSIVTMLDHSNRLFYQRQFIEIDYCINVRL